MSELWEVLVRHFPEFRSGFLVTVQLVAVSFAIAIGVGLFVGALRVAPVRWVRWLGGLYVEFFRNIPLLVLLSISYLGLRRAGIPIGPWVAGTASLGLYTAAYVAETIRSGVFAVGKGQIDAGLALGFTYRRVLSQIVIPQAVGSLIIAMIKNSAIIGSVFALADDLLKEARLISSATFQYNEVFFWAAVGYLLLTVSVTFAIRAIERRLVVRR
jgi:aspartate/glutamate/glutamine transport system permease protein